MAKTKIQDVIVPEIFNNYVIERTAELSALFQSGIISTDATLNALAQAGGRIINMPFWTDLDGDDEVLSDTQALTPDKIQAGQDAAALIMRGKAWSANDLARALSGDDPMGTIANLVADYWARRWQRILLSTLEGVFDSNTMADNYLDISGQGAAADNSISGFTLMDAFQRLGDAKDRLTAMAMHSQTMTSLAKQDLIQFERDSTGRPTIPMYQGKRVIVDDGLPVAGNTYTTYIFGEGAIGFGEGGAPVPTEMDRDSLAGDDILINRRHFILHPRGVRFTDTNVADSSPTNLEFADGNNWNRVYEPKNVRIVKFDHQIQLP